MVQGRAVTKLFEGGKVTAMATAIAFVNGAGMEVLLTVVSDEKVMLLLDSRKDAGGCGERTHDGGADLRSRERHEGYGAALVVRFPASGGGFSRWRNSGCRRWNVRLWFLVCGRDGR